MTQIVHLLLDRMKTELTTALITNISGSDPSRASEVKIGRFQDDPTKSSIYAAISGGNPDDPKYVDGILTLESMANLNFTMPPREIGGGQMWWRRGVIKVGCFFIGKYDEEVASEYAYEFLGRLTNEIEQIFVADLTDSYEEHAIKLFCYGNTFFEGGGPPKNYIYRGSVYWCCLTERP